MPITTPPSIWLRWLMGSRISATSWALRTSYRNTCPVSTSTPTWAICTQKLVTASSGSPPRPPWPMPVSLTVSTVTPWAASAAKVQGAVARGVCTNSAGAPGHLVYRDAQYPGHLPLQRLAELQDAQVRCLRGRDRHTAATHTRVIGEVCCVYVADDHVVQGQAESCGHHSADHRVGTGACLHEWHLGLYAAVGLEF